MTKKKTAIPESRVLLRVSEQALLAARHGDKKAREALLDEVLDVYAKSVPRLVMCEGLNCTNKFVHKGWFSRQRYCSPKCGAQGYARKKQYEGGIVDAAIDSGDLRHSKARSVRAQVVVEDE